MRSCLLLALLPALAIGQTGGGTWQGLQFGMSENAVKQKLTALYQLETSKEKGHFAVKPDYELKVPGLRITFEFEPELFFTDAGLAIVSLAADVPKMISQQPSLTASLVAGTGGPAIYEQLTSKYGAPISTEGQCEDVPVRMLILSSTDFPTCKASWKADAQLVEYYWWFSGKINKLTMIVEYKATSSGL